jgi:PAS domain S-box-containing protein
MNTLSIHLLSIPALMVAGSVFFVGFSHLLLARRRVHTHLNLMFALSCLAMGAYDMFSAGLYSAADAAEGVLWQQGQFVSLAFLGFFLLWFVADTTGAIPRRVVFAFCSLFAVFGVAAAVWPELFLNAGQPMDRTVRAPWIGLMSHPEATLLPLAQLQGLVGLAALLVSLWASYRCWRRVDRRRGRRMFQAFSIFLAGVLHDTAVGSGLYAAPYVMEYAYMAIVLVMAAFLSREVAGGETVRQLLEETEKRFRSVFRNVSVGIGLTAPDGTLLQTNSALATMFGRHPDELVGAGILSFFHADDRAAIEGSLQDLLSGDIATYRDERRYLQPGGRELWADVTAGLIRSGDGSVEAVTWILVGITERRLAVESLQTMNEQLEERIRERTQELTESNRQLGSSLQQLEEDEGAAELIQFSLMPEEHKTLNGLSFSRYLHPSTQMSGDFLDYFAVGRGHTAFYIADVSGHGVSAAFITVLLNNFVRRMLERYQEKADAVILDPAAFLTTINRELRLQDLGKHVTFFYGVVNHEANTLSFASAGHFPFPVLHASGRHEVLQAKGPPLGLFEGSAYSAGTLPLPQAFSLIAFSDGVLDIIPHQHLRDKQQYLSTLANQPEMTLSDVVSRLSLDRAQATPDDITILLVRRGPSHG